MSVEIVTKEDLQQLRILLMDDIRKLLEKSNSSSQLQEWLKSAEVRKILKVSAGTLQNLRISGRLKPVKIEGTWYYNVNEIKDLFSKQ